MTTTHAPQSLADGPAGQAILARERGEDPRQWLAAMTLDPIQAHPDEAGLYDGAPAIAFTLSATAHAPSRSLMLLDQHVERITRVRLAAAHRRISRGELADKREYDLINGLTGLGAYLLHRHDTHPVAVDRVGELLRDMLGYLVHLTRPHSDGRPGWWARSGPTGPGSGWEDGHANVGMAHGITGPLALLALTRRRGVSVPDQLTAMDRICAWLDHWRCGAPPHVWWPEAISYDEHRHGVPRSGGPHRPSWCYGTPGIARALQLAGLALGDANRQRTAEDALAWCVTDPAQLARLGDMSLCHGWAGLVHTAWRASHHSTRLAAAVPALLDHLGEQHPDTAAGLLTGTAGTALARRAASTGTEPVTRWDTCLLLND